MEIFIVKTLTAATNKAKEIKMNFMMTINVSLLNSELDCVNKGDKETRRYFTLNVNLF